MLSGYAASVEITAGSCTLGKRKDAQGVIRPRPGGQPGFRWYAHDEYCELFLDLTLYWG